MHKYFDLVTKFMVFNFKVVRNILKTVLEPIGKMNVDLGVAGYAYSKSRIRLNSSHFQETFYKHLMGPVFT